MTPIERELTSLLDERASSYDARAAIPRSVARRARIYRSATAAATGAVVAAVVAASFAVSGGLTSAERVRPAAPTPRPERERLESFTSSMPGPFDAKPRDIVAEGRVGGRRWMFSVGPDGGEDCMTLETARSSASFCGGWGGADPVFVGSRVRVDGTRRVGVFGYASPDVARITATTAFGVTATAKLEPAGDRLPRPLGVWVVFVPQGPGLTLVAEDADGRTLWRHTTPRRPDPEPR
ncbi:MAG TPA: hypothetical protein VHJ34_14795 [Actinomycetota bacterium]|nr:hypothetical protein [Actinomycetota bacterium]